MFVFVYFVLMCFRVKNGCVWFVFILFCIVCVLFIVYVVSMKVMNLSVLLSDSNVMCVMMLLYVLCLGVMYGLNFIVDLCVCF